QQPRDVRTSQERVVIPGGIEELGPPFSQFEDPIEDLRVGAIPPPACPQLPPVEKVPENEELLRTNLPEIRQEMLDLSEPAPEVHVAHEQRPHATLPFLRIDVHSSLLGCRVTALRDRSVRRPARDPCAAVPRLSSVPSRERRRPGPARA